MTVNYGYLKNETNLVRSNHTSYCCYLYVFPVPTIIRAPPLTNERSYITLPTNYATVLFERTRPRCCTPESQSYICSKRTNVRLLYPVSGDAANYQSNLVTTIDQTLQIMANETDQMTNRSEGQHNTIRQQLTYYTVQHISVVHNHENAFFIQSISHPKVR